MMTWLELRLRRNASRVSLEFKEELVNTFADSLFSMIASKSRKEGCASPIPPVESWSWIEEGP